MLRYQPPQAGRREELFQIGVEHIGNGMEADLEVLVMAIEALEHLGIEDGVLTLGHAGWLAGVLAAIEGKGVQRQRVLEGLRRRDPRALDELAGQRHVPLRQILQLCGPRLVLERAETFFSSRTARAALDHLDRLADALESLGLGGKVQFDLGAVLSFDYYTGMVFEIHVAGSGRRVGGGGRYDGLIGRFGVERPAVGFSLCLDELAALLMDRPLPWTKPERPQVVPWREGPSAALARAMELRRQGKKVMLR